MNSLSRQFLIDIRPDHTISQAKIAFITRSIGLTMSNLTLYYQGITYMKWNHPNSRLKCACVPLKWCGAASHLIKITVLTVMMTVFIKYNQFCFLHYDNVYKQNCVLARNVTGFALPRSLFYSNMVNIPGCLPYIGLKTALTLFTSIIFIPALKIRFPPPPISQHVKK